MKRTLKLSTTTKRQPFLGETFNHIYESILETADALARGLVGNYSTGDVVILYGCTLTGFTSGAANPWATTAGAIFYNGEVYLVPASSGVFSGVNVLVGTITTTYRAGDPVQLSDLSSANQHEIRTIVLNQGASGSGIGNYTNYRNVLRLPALMIADDTGVTISATAAWVLLTTMTYTTPNDGLTRKYKIRFKCLNTGGANSENNVQFRMFNTTTLTQYDFSQFFDRRSSSVNDGTNTVVVLETIQNIAPNNTIEIQRLWALGSDDTDHLKMFIEEIR